MSRSPTPPNPYQTADAQQRSDTGAGITQSILGNPNTFTPYGSQTYSIAGYEQVPGANGQMLTVPRYNLTQQLSPDQQKLLGLSTQTQFNMGQTAVEQSEKLRSHLGTSIDTSGLNGWNAGPQAGQSQLATTFGGNNPMQMSIAGGGPIQKGVGSGGPIQKQIAGGGTIQGKLQGQNVRQDQGATDRAAIEEEMMRRYSADAGRQQQQQDAQLAARGMNVGTQGYGQVQEARDRARTDAGGQAYLASGQESRAAQDAYNQAAQQRFQQGATQGAFANQAQLQRFQQNAGQGAFANAAQAQQFGQGLQQGQFANTAQAQQFNQNATQGAFANSAQAQAYAQALQRAGFSNDAITQMFAMQGQTADRGNAMRGQQFQELLAMRNQPINEISALLAGGQVTLPQFQGYQSQGVNAAPVGQYIGQNYAQQSANTNAFNSGLFGIAGLGGQIAGNAWGQSDRRLKMDIEPTGETLAGLPLYTFRYKAEPTLEQVGVMSDEARILHPDAVAVINGFDAVDYGLLRSRHKEKLI